MTHDSRPATRRLRVGSILVTMALLLTASPAMATPSAAAQPPADLPNEPAFVVALEADGSARLTLTVTFDLTTDREGEAFEALQANTTAREQRTDRFASRIQAIADRAETDTGREMAIRDPTIAFVERNETGIVALSVTWDGLADRSGDELVLGEPFSGDFGLDRPFVIIGPEGYELDTVTPAPTERSTNAATWAAGTSLEGFEATFVPADEPATTGPATAEGMTTRTGADAPGFGMGVAILALVLGVALRLSAARPPR